MRRDLRVVRSGLWVGAVELDGEEARFDGAAADVFARARERVGSVPLVRSLLAEGWSNGYLYLAEADGRHD